MSLHLEHTLSNMVRPFVAVGFYAKSDDGSEGTHINVTVGVGALGPDPVAAVDVTFDLPVAWRDGYWRTP